MRAILAQKILMTRIFDDQGLEVPVTLLKMENSRVAQVKTKEKDGYEAVQIAAGQKRKLNQCLEGHIKKAGLDFKPKQIFEIKTQKSYTVGDEITLSEFQEGDIIHATAVSKGKGFAGTVKRHNFNTGPKSHGSHNYRQPGSIGATDAARVFKGRRMSGHLGHKQATVQNLKIVKIDSENQELMVRGAVPGPNNNYVLIWSKHES